MPVVSMDTRRTQESRIRSFVLSVTYRKHEWLKGSTPSLATIILMDLDVFTHFLQPKVQTEYSAGSKAGQCQRDRVLGS